MVFQRDLPWETYLHRFGFKEDISRGLQRIAPPQTQLAGYAQLLAAEDELNSILERTLLAPILSVDPRTVTPEGLQSTFDWAMGSSLWKMELPRQSILDLVATSHNQGTQSIIEARRRAEMTYLNGKYADAVRAFQTLESGNYQDFSLFLTAGHLFLYHQKPAELDKARAAYLKAGIYAMPKAPLYAGRALLWAAFVAYLQHDDVSAFEYAQRALQVTPQWGEAWYTLARISAATHKPDDALPALEQAIRADRNYSLRAAVDPDFVPIETEVTAFFERLRQEARQQADVHGKALLAQTTTSPLPTLDQVASQHLQTEISERWRQDSYFGYLDSAAKMMRFKLYVDGLHLPERDRILSETNQVLKQLRSEISSDSLTPAMKERFQNDLHTIETSVGAVPNLTQAQVSLNKAHTTQALWHLAANQTSLVGHAAEVNLVVFDPSSRWLASGGPWEQSIRLWDILTTETRAMLAGHLDGVNSLVFTPDSQTLVSGGGHFKGEDFTIRLWELAESRTRSILDGHKDMVTALAVDQSGRLLASGSADSTALLWSLPTGEKLSAFHGHQSAVTCLAFNPEAKTLISGGEDQTIRLWDVDSADQVGVLLGHEAAISGIYLSPDGVTLTSYAADQTIRRWDIANHQLLSVHEQPGRITTLAMSSDGSHLAWALAEDGKIRFWQPGNDQPPVELVGHTSRITTLAFSTDNQFLASGSETGIVRIWDAATGKGKAIRIGHTDRINSLAFSPDSILLASCSRDKTIRLWGLILSAADAEAIETEERELHEQEIKAAEEAREKAERQRLAWIKDGRCEICGTKLGLVDRIAKRTRCKEHRS